MPLALSLERETVEIIRAAVGDEKLLRTFEICPGRRMEIDLPHIVAVSDDHRWVIGTLPEAFATRS